MSVPIDRVKVCRRLLLLDDVLKLKWLVRLVPLQLFNYLFRVQQLITLIDDDNSPYFPASGTSRMFCTHAVCHRTKTLPDLPLEVIKIILSYDSYHSDAVVVHLGKNFNARNNTIRKN